MINCELSVKKLSEIAIENGGTIRSIGASNLSDALYLNITKPKIICDIGVLETWNILIRVSNHYNDTNTSDRLSADLFENYYDQIDFDDICNSLKNFLKNAELIEEN